MTPSPMGAVSTLSHCRSAKKEAQFQMDHLGLRRHPTEGDWGGGTKVEHLGVIVDSVHMHFYPMPRKIEKILGLAAKLLNSVRFGRRWVNPKIVEHFCGVCVSLTLAMPWERFYIRALYWEISVTRLRDKPGRCRQSHQSIRDLQSWRRLTKEELDGSPMVSPEINATVHSDAADLGYRRTLNSSENRPGISGQLASQGVWNWKDRAKTITYRELRAVRVLLSEPLGKEVVRKEYRNLLPFIDNQAVVHITNSLVSTSRPMMRELRRLKVALDSLGLRIRSEWIPSVANKFANGLSRRFPRGDLQIRRDVRRSEQDGMKAPRDAFPYRPVGEHPLLLRRQTFKELSEPWSPSEVRLLCPPVDLRLPYHYHCISMQ